MSSSSTFTARRAAHLDFWRRHLASLDVGAPAVAPPTTLLPSAAPGEAAAAGSREGEVPVAAEALEALRALTRGSAFLVHCAYTAVVEEVLRRWNTQGSTQGNNAGKFLLASPHYARAEAGAEAPPPGVVLYLAADPAEARGRSFQQALMAARERWMEAYGHQDLPFSVLLRESGLAAGGGTSEADSDGAVRVALRSAGIHGELSPALPWELRLEASGAARWWAAAGVAEEGDGERFAAAVATLLGAALAAPTAPLDSLSELPPGLREEILQQHSGAAVTAPGEPFLAAADVALEQDADSRYALSLNPLSRLVRGRALAWMDAPAVEEEDGASLSYRQLLKGSEAWSRQLASRVITEDAAAAEQPRIGVALPRSAALVQALLAVLDLGGAYVPLDPAYPAQRLRLMLEDGVLGADGGGLVLVDASTAPIFHALAEELPGLRVLTVEELSDPAAGASAAPKAPIPASIASPLALAYILYTSGSTGRPKGVAMAQGPLINLLAWQCGDADLGRPGRRAQFASPSFDGSFREIFSSLCSGGCLVTVPEALRSDAAGLARFLGERKIDKLLLPAVMLRHLVAEAGALEAADADALEGLKGLREVFTAGEQLRVNEGLRAFFAARPEARLHNHYGPTETHVASAQPLAADPAQWPVLPPIGRPLPGLRLYVVSADLKPLPPGAVGELVIGGVAVARGYWRRPRRTALAFVPDPFRGEGDASGERLYRTGDLARLRPGGVVEFLGRRDQQVKVRGYRIEPGEVEAALAALDSVKEAAVDTRPVPGVKPGEGGESRLVAWVVPRRPQDPPTPAALRQALAEHLPEPLVPSAWVLLDRMPTSANRKLDRRALPDPPAAVGGAGRAPESATERLLARAWSELLEVEAPGTEDDFFSLGGHSLLAVRVVARLRDALEVEVPVRTFFQHPTLGALAAAVDELLQEGGRDALPPLEPGPSGAGRRAPLSYTQERMWVVQRMEPNSSAYHLPTVLELEGELDAAALDAAVVDLLERHQVLRSVFRQGPEGPYQEVLPTASVASPRGEGEAQGPLAVVDLSAVDEARAEALAEALCREEALYPFDLAQGPITRTRLLRLAPRRHWLLVTQHHAAGDAWSTGLLVRDLTALYSAHRQRRPQPLAPLPVQYVDFAEWQRRYLSGAALESRIEAWRPALEGLEVEPLVPDHSLSAARTAGAGRASMVLDAEVYGALQELARSHGATPFMALTAGWLALDHRLSGAARPAVGSPVAGRPLASLEGLVGFFVNLITLTAPLPDAEALGFDEYLRRVKDASLEAFGGAEVPFERLVESLAPGRGGASSPFFRSVLSMQNAPSETLDLPGLRLQLRDGEPTGVKFDLVVSLAPVEGPRGEALVVAAEYDAGLYEATTIHRLLDSWRRLLSSAVATPEAPLASLAVSSVAQRHQVLYEWSGDALAEPRYGEDSLPRRVALQALRAPEKIALVDAASGEELSYGGLQRRAQELASELRRRGLERGQVASLFLPRSPDLVVAMLAVLQVGAAYLPLDPDFPKERLEWMLGDSRSPVMITRGDLWPQGVPTDGPVAWVLLDAPDPDALLADVLGESAPETAANLEESSVALEGVGSDDLAYVLYTSGSTGRPKGVAVPHRAVLRLVLPPGGAGWARMDGEEIWLGFAPAAFDASTLEIWGSLAHGATLVLAPTGPIAPAALAKLVEERGVTSLWLTAALFRQVVERGLDHLGGVRQLLAGGDVLPMESVRAVLREQPGIRLVNGYGPTENTTFTCCHPLERADLPRPAAPVGRAVEGTRVVILDRGFQPAVMGAAGELCAGGAGLARGYFGQPALTADRFVPDPFPSEPGARLYRTGDRARFSHDGRVEFLGRVDRQVKIRGFRIEPAEVESALEAHPVVSAAVVLAAQEERAPGVPGEAVLVAYVECSADDEGAEKPSVAQLREHLRGLLPAAMVPSFLLLVDRLPVGPTGKVDRGALPVKQDLARLRGGGREGAAPSTEMEQQLAALFREVLNLEREIAVDESFFDLGGHSLNATQLVARIEETVGRRLPLATVFHRPTVAGLALELDGGSGAGADAGASDAGADAGDAAAGDAPAGDAAPAEDDALLDELLAEMEGLSAAEASSLLAETEDDPESATASAPEAREAEVGSDDFLDALLAEMDGGEGKS
ncbi:MAG: amino acid adenylation domain-containing protein [Acidobacteriota bacterium]